jgi:catechol 2,3-dioxygenase-like lactoylglutathione lyase family enzyme
MNSNGPFERIDHVQLAMPAGGEDPARAFYTRLLGMTEIEKPSDLRSRGGVWFASGDVQLHLGVESDFRPAKKAHPALRCRDYLELIALLRGYGVAVRDEETPLPDGSAHAYIDDPFGNRIELVSM